MTTLAVFGAMAGAVAASAWLVVGILAEPTLAPVPAGDGARALQKLAMIAGTARGRPRQAPDVISLTEGELNAVLGHRLAEFSELPISRVHLRLPGGGRAEIAGRTTLAAILGERPFNRLASLLPSKWQETPVWLRLRVQPRIDPKGDGRRRYLRLEVERFWLGQRRLPSTLLRLILSPATLTVLHLRLPDAVREVSVEAGRVDVTRIASP